MIKIALETDIGNGCDFNDKKEFLDLKGVFFYIYSLYLRTWT